MKLVVPHKIFEQHTAVLGKTGSGKSSAMRYLVEELLDEKKPVCIIDPKGDWFGLKSSADGKSAGYEVVIFGGEHADVPIDAHAGASVAELVATGNRPAIIDLGGWTVHDRTRFFIDFAAALFKTSRGQRWLVVDEVHNFAPKGKIMSPEAGMMLHWANRLASEGRGKGVNLIVASQRPQKVHNDLLTSCETLISMRVIHPRDREAIAEWLEGAGDKEKANEVLSTLAAMKRGEGWVWSPEIEFGPERVTFPLFKTFDSFAANANSGMVKLKGWASVNLDEVRAKLAETIAKAKADDPKELRKQIAEMKRTIAEKAIGLPVTAPAKTKIIEKPIFKDSHVKRLEAVAEKLVAVGMAAGTLGKELGDKLTAVLKAGNAVKLPAHIPPILRSPAAILHDCSPRRPVAARDPNTPEVGVGNGGLRRMLTALAQRPSGLSVKQIAVRSGMSSNSGTFGVYLGRMRASGWVDGDRSRMKITDSGISALGDYQPLGTGAELLAYWISELGQGGASRMLRELAAVYPNGLTKEQLATAAEMSVQSGTFGVYLGRLRSLELIEGKSELRASAELFQE